MERLTLENAINRSRKLAERHRWNSENTKLETSDENANEVYKNTCIQYANQEEQYAEWLEELKSYKDIGTPKELKELKENGALNGLELAKLAIMQKELKKYKDLEEQGLLVRLPVAIGSKVYTIFSFFDCIYNYDNCKATQKWKCEEDIPCKYEKKLYCVKEIEFDLTLKDAIGKTVFLTREEAEKKLEEMKKNGK